MEEVKIVVVSAEAYDAATAVPLDRAEAESQGWLQGPPYAVAEEVFDECDLPGCSLNP